MKLLEIDFSWIFAPFEFHPAQEGPGVEIYDIGQAIPRNNDVLWSGRSCLKSAFVKGRTISYMFDSLPFIFGNNLKLLKFV